EIEGTLAEEPAMKVEAERTHAPTQFVTRLEEGGEHCEELRRDIGCEDLRVRQQAARRKNAAAAAGSDVLHSQRRLAVDSRERQAAIDELNEIEAFEVALIIGRGVIEELARHMGRRPSAVDENGAVAQDLYAFCKKGL